MSRQRTSPLSRMHPLHSFRSLALALALTASLGAVQPAAWASGATPDAQASHTPQQATSAVSVTPLPPGVQQGPSIEGITEYRLGNGLTVLLAPDASKPTTTVNMTYLVGSRHEGRGETGMAHLLEHMLFKGTETTRNALGEFSRRGLQANGSTSVDRTNYFASFSANPDTLEWYLGWQADAMVNSLILREDLDSEMTVVRNEMESGENNPFRVLMQKMQAASYQWHNYGKSTIGSRSDVENVDIDQLRAFYHQYYQPDNAVLTVSGKFDPVTTLADIARIFGKLSRPARTLPAEYTVEPVQDGERMVTLRRQGGIPLVAALYHAPAAAHPDMSYLDLATLILADTPSGRLYQALIPTGQAASVFGFAMDRNQPGQLMFGAQLEQGQDVELALDTVVSTLEDTLTQRPFTQEELDRARNQWMSQWQQLYSDAESVGVALSEAIAAGDWRLLFLQRDRIRDATLEQVQRAAVEFLVPSNRTAGRYIPTEQPLRAPSTEPIDLAATLKDYRGDPDFRQVGAFDPSPANIEALTQRSTLELPSGPVELALLPKEARGERVEARLRMRFADAAQLDGQRLASSATAELLANGTRNLSRQQIHDKVNALQGELYFSGGGNTLTVSMSTTGANLPALMDIAFDVLKNPIFPADQIEEYRRQAIASIQSAMTEPSALAQQALARYDNPWKPDDIRYTPSFEQMLAAYQALDRKQLKVFHERFYGAGDISFSAVGEFDPDSVKQALSQGLSTWKKAPTYVRLDSPYRDIPAKTFDIDTPDKANAFYLAIQPLQLQDTNPDYPALYLANFLLGTSETSRLWNRVREQDGLSYNVRSQLTVSAFEPSSSWSVYAIFAPENRARLEQAINEELARALKDGFGDQEVADGITALLNYRALSYAQDGALAGLWLGYLDRDRDFNWAVRLDERLRALKASEVNAALRKYLKPADFSKAIAGDFKPK
ncbi:MAG: pitrilysin family protein [Corticimicrobacter sp.]|uniref:M16 family metallopeptidase n=1 Tax=Corticimicrobacter sp. TaxID=2678536 RepID=UPI0032DA8E6A